MLESIFNNFLNTFVRNLDRDTQLLIGFCLFGFSLWCFKNSVRKKSDKRPIKLGYMVLCLISLALSVVYVQL